jgi:hypothetical protein
VLNKLGQIEAPSNISKYMQVKLRSRNNYDSFYGTKINWFLQQHQDGFCNECLTCLTYNATGFHFCNRHLFVFVFAFDDLVFASNIYLFLFLHEKELIKSRLERAKAILGNANSKL